jgi:hypothetical protein
MILLLFYVWYEAKFLNEFGIWSVPYWVPVVGGKIVFVICTVFGFDLGRVLLPGGIGLWHFSRNNFVHL